jgi:hypothetical protein
MARLKTPQLIERRCKFAKTTDFRLQQMAYTLFEVSLRQYACFFLFSGLLGFQYAFCARRFIRSDGRTVLASFRSKYRPHK